jgi:hypothetical protein
MNTTIAPATDSTAAALWAAAALIDCHGYTPYPEYETATGLSVHDAADIAASDAGEFTDRIETAFAGWLQLRGLVTGTALRHDPIGTWERQDGGRPQDEVTRELRAAAAALDQAALAEVATMAARQTAGTR